MNSPKEIFSNKTNFERSICLNDFYRFALAHVLETDLKIGYFGSKSNPDPEILILQKLGVARKNMHSLGIGDDVEYQIDLDKDSWNYDITFDILIISNVFEHIYNLNNAFNNITKMTKLGTYLYIIGPTYNFYHLSPNFYSSGYDYLFFKKNLELINFVEHSSRRIGTKRLYFMQHNLSSWPSIRAHRFPILFAFDEVKLPLRYFLYLKNVLYLIIAQLKSTTLTDNPNFSTGMLIILKRLR
jgi:hypothetical protein